VLNNSGTVHVVVVIVVVAVVPAGTAADRHTGRGT
jgi:hypothetical protein